MNKFSRIWVLVIGIAVAAAIGIGALFLQGASSPAESGTPGTEKKISAPNPAVVLKKVLEKVHLTFPYR
jgi:low affinity Fe/Cu permease